MPQHIFPLHCNTVSLYTLRTSYLPAFIFLLHSKFKPIHTKISHFSGIHPISCPYLSQTKVLSDFFFQMTTHHFQSLPRSMSGWTKKPVEGQSLGLSIVLPLFKKRGKGSGSLLHLPLIIPHDIPGEDW